MVSAHSKSAAMVDIFFFYNACTITVCVYAYGNTMYCKWNRFAQRDISFLEFINSPSEPEVNERFAEVAGIAHANTSTNDYIYIMKRSPIENGTHTRSIHDVPHTW